MCEDAREVLTLQQFRHIPGLARHCVLDDNVQIQRAHALMSIYSNHTAVSMNAARWPA